uniref:Paired box protein Pax-6 n=1 Tax=Junco hyemalis TaxID=40217 RepID=A0A8C5JJF9_JUNHY
MQHRGEERGVPGGTRGCAVPPFPAPPGRPFTRGSAGPSRPRAHPAPQPVTPCPSQIPPVLFLGVFSCFLGPASPFPARTHLPSTAPPVPQVPPALKLCPQVSNGCVSKILGRYYRTGAVGPKAAGGSKPRMATPAVVARIARLKLEQPGLFAWQIRRQLHAEGTCAGSGIPSVSPHRVRPSRRPSVPAGSPPAALPAPQPPAAPGSREPPPGPGHRSGARNRTVFSRQQAEALEEAFRRGQYPDSATRERLAAATRLPDSTIRVWFSNRRAKWRRESKRQLEAGGAGDSAGTEGTGRGTQGRPWEGAWLAFGAGTPGLLPRAPLGAGEGTRRFSGGSREPGQGTVRARALSEPGHCPGQGIVRPRALSEPGHCPRPCPRRLLVRVDPALCRCRRRRTGRTWPLSGGWGHPNRLGHPLERRSRREPCLERPGALGVSWSRSSPVTRHCPVPTQPLADPPAGSAQPLHGLAPQPPPAPLHLCASGPCDWDDVCCGTRGRPRPPRAAGGALGVPCQGPAMPEPRVRPAGLAPGGTPAPAPWQPLESAPFALLPPGLPPLPAWGLEPR